MSTAPLLGTLHISAVRGGAAILPLLPRLQQLALQYGQPGTMHGLHLLIGSAFNRRKLPVLLCFHPDSSSAPSAAVLLLEYRPVGLPSGVFATADAFGVRTVVGPTALHPELCQQAAQFLLRSGGRLVLATCRVRVPAPPCSPAPFNEDFLFAATLRTVQDTLPLQASAEATLQRLGKRTRTHMRAARRRFDLHFPAELVDATEELARADDAALRDLNAGSMDVIQQGEFDHQVRSLCRAPGGFAIGLVLEGRFISLAGGWRHGAATWIEWQCNSRGFEKFSLGSVLRTYLFEEEVRRGCTHLHFHGGTSHSMVHGFVRTQVVDLLALRPGLLNNTLIRLLRVVCGHWPGLLRRGNFVLDALCAPGLHWVPASAFLWPATTNTPAERDGWC